MIKNFQTLYFKSFKSEEYPDYQKIMKGWFGKWMFIKSQSAIKFELREVRKFIWTQNSKTEINIFREIKFICLKLLVQGHFHGSSRIRAASLMRNISWLMSFCGILVFSVWGSSMTNLIDAFYHSPAKFDFNPKITYTGVSVWF